MRVLPDSVPCSKKCSQCNASMGCKCNLKLQLQISREKLQSPRFAKVANLGQSPPVLLTTVRAIADALRVTFTGVTSC